MLVNTQPTQSDTCSVQVHHCEWKDSLYSIHSSSTPHILNTVHIFTTLMIISASPSIHTHTHTHTCTISLSLYDVSVTSTTPMASHPAEWWVHAECIFSLCSPHHPHSRVPSFHLSHSLPFLSSPSSSSSYSSSSSSSSLSFVFVFIILLWCVSRLCTIQRTIHLARWK